jgi:hypothetical protein
MRISKVRRTDFRTARPASDPPGAGVASPLERDCQPRPRAVACPSFSGKRTAAENHALWLFDLSDRAIAGIIADAERRNLRDQRDHETRWMSERSSAARAVRRLRQAAGEWTLPKKRFSLFGG